jgi:enoyl-CoA hydratase/carnithine racemase
MTGLVLTEDHGGVRLLTLNRPEKRNAFDLGLTGALWDALEAASTEPSVRVVVLTAAGTYFSAGADVNLFLAMGTPDAGDITKVARLYEPILASDKPVIAAVQGPAVGMGVTMLPHFDMVYAADTATFTVPFMRLGLGVEYAGSFHLTRLLGLQRAKELVLRGKAIDAETAKSWGLVTRTFPSETLLSSVLEIASDIASHPAGAVRDARAVLNLGLETQRMLETVAEENRVLTTRYGSPENVEAVMAFLSRKK